jgi:hypothetical protein
MLTHNGLTYGDNSGLPYLPNPKTSTLMEVVIRVNNRYAVTKLDGVHGYQLRLIENWNGKDVFLFKESGFSTCASAKNRIDELLKIESYG